MLLLASGKPLTKRAESGFAIKCTDPRIQIRLKMSRIRNTGCIVPPILKKNKIPVLDMPTILKSRFRILDLLLQLLPEKYDSLFFHLTEFWCEVY
jgi:hypothetical protein